ncbi:MAG: flagellar hook-associated protein 3 [Hydrogenimonas sp.]|nr:MAG: flagellar hook-associated protein 3 [Hydrogenimonas sp.]
MRVTQNRFYNTFITDQSKIKEQLDTVNRQISSGMKIKYGYEDVSVFADTLRLDYEENALDQSINISKDAENFINNTDSVMFQMTDTLTRFKTLLIQSANGTNSENNYFALANELKSLKEHMINLGNSSINGRFLFSGSALDVKPLDEHGNYYGNNDTIKAVISEDVEIPYNIPGEELFFGEDANMNRKVTTNIPLTRLNSDEAVTLNTTISELRGTNEDYTFTIQGRKSDGSTFNNSVVLTSDKTVQDILNTVADQFGRDLVDVSLSNGYIQVTDKFQGSSLLDLHLYAESNSDTIEFVKSANVGADVYHKVPFSAKGSIFSGNIPLTVMKDTTNGTNLVRGDFAQTNTLLTDLTTTSSIDGKSLTLELNGNTNTINLDDTMTVQNLLDTINTTINSQDARAFLDDRGHIIFENLNGSDVITEVALYSNSTPPDFLFNTNGTLTIDDPKHDLFSALDEAIEAVENGMIYPDGTNLVNPRNPGIENAIERINHVFDHVAKEHTKVGAISQSLNYSIERNEMLKSNVQILRSDILDTDIAEATMKLNQLSLNFQAMLASVAKIQNLSLVKYM